LVCYLTDEAREMVTLTIEQMQPHPSLTEDLKGGLVSLSGGHIGLLISLLDALSGVPVSIVALFYRSDIECPLTWMFQ